MRTCCSVRESVVCYIFIRYWPSGSTKFSWQISHQLRCCSEAPRARISPYPDREKLEQQKQVGRCKRLKQLKRSNRSYRASAKAESGSTVEYTAKPVTTSRECKEA